MSNTTGIFVSFLLAVEMLWPKSPTAFVAIVIHAFLMLALAMLYGYRRGFSDGQKQRLW